MERYKLELNGGEPDIEPAMDGTFVFYDDAIAAVAAERERWIAACREVGIQHAATGREMLRAAHFSEAVGRVQLLVGGPNVEVQPGATVLRCDSAGTPS